MQQTENPELTPEQNAHEEGVDLQTDAISALKTKLAEYEDFMKRQQAEFDNYRKRVIKEKEDTLKYGALTVFKDLLPIKDNFERALESAQDDKGFKALRQGMEMILRQFEEIFTRNGVKETPGQGSIFDPNLHQSIALENDDTADEDMVAEVFQKGYCQYDRLLRLAQVKIRQAAKKQKGE